MDSAEILQRIYFLDKYSGTRTMKSSVIQTSEVLFLLRVEDLGLLSGIQLSGALETLQRHTKQTDEACNTGSIQILLTPFP